MQAARHTRRHSYTCSSSTTNSERGSKQLIHHTSHHTCSRSVVKLQAAAAAAGAAVCVQPAPDAPSAPAVCVEQTLAVCSPPSSELPRHTWGHGLSVGQFKAAVEALPMQQPLRWKSLYPAIGSGARGQVFQAVNLDTGGLLAVKVVPLKHLMGRSHEAALRREALVLELAAMQDHLHPNLLSMQGFCFKPSATKPSLEIFSELGSCLEDLMPEEGGRRLELGLVQKVLRAVLSALEFLHGRGVVHRDVKPGNILSVGSSGNFKLIDMDSIFYTGVCDEEQCRDRPAGGEACSHQQEQQQQRQRLGGVMGNPCSASFSAHLAGGAAARVKTVPKLQLPPPPSQQQQQQQQERASVTTSIILAAGGTIRSSRSPSTPQQQQQQQKQQGPACNALTFAGSPENMAPECAPTVLQLPVVLWDVFPLKDGKQVASSTAVAPAQDIWSVGTVLYELLTGRSLFDMDSPEELYQHLAKLRAKVAALPVMPSGLDVDVLEVLEACLQVNPAARPTATQLLAMNFFLKTY